MILNVIIAFQTLYGTVTFQWHLTKVKLWSEISANISVKHVYMSPIFCDIQPLNLK